MIRKAVSIEPADHSHVKEWIQRLTEQYDGLLGTASIGKSLCGHEITALHIGSQHRGTHDQRWHQHLHSLHSICSYVFILPSDSQVEGAACEAEVDVLGLDEPLLQPVGQLGGGKTDGGTRTDVVQIVAVAHQPVDGSERSHSEAAYGHPGRQLSELMTEHGGTGKGEHGVPRGKGAAVAAVRTFLGHELLERIGRHGACGIGGHSRQGELRPGCAVVEVAGFQREHGCHRCVLQHIVEGVAAMMLRCKRDACSEQDDGQPMSHSGRTRAGCRARCP